MGYGIWRQIIVVITTAHLRRYDSEDNPIVIEGEHPSVILQETQ